MAMTRALRGAGKASSDATTKELIKIAKSQINDKVLIIRAASLEVYKKN